MVAITARDRPKTDYERWLELQGSDDAAGSDEKQYHPPAPPPVPEHGQGAHAKADDDTHKYTPHGTFIHHGYHHERPGASADNNIIANNHPHAMLPHHLDSSFSGNYGGVAMKLALLVFVVLGLLRAVRFVRGRRYQPIRLQSPSTVQGGFGGREDGGKRNLV